MRNQVEIVQLNLINSPTLPSSISRLISIHFGSVRWLNIPAYRSLGCFFCASAKRSSLFSASTAVTATGFSTSAWTPASKAMRAKRGWSKCGHAISTASISPERIIASPSVHALAPVSSAMGVTRSSLTSQTAASSSPSIVAA